MIFASVGTMLPFDRFVQGVDEWAGANPAQEVFVQIGDGAYEPRHCAFSRIVGQDDYRRRLAACDLFVAHVGMGSILQALEARKPMVLMPRRASLREHTTDHQLDTAAMFADTPGLLIVDDVAALQQAMTRLIDAPMAGSAGISPVAPTAFTDRIARFLRHGD